MSVNAIDGHAVSRQSMTQVIDQSGGKDAATAAWLARYFGVTVTHPPAATAVAGTPRASPTSAVAGAGGVLVILGQGEETAFLGNPGVGR
jgi:hypothetical protein